MKGLINYLLPVTIGSGSIIGYIVWKNKGQELSPPPSSVTTNPVNLQQSEEETEELKQQTKKQQIGEEADKAFQKINDYSFRLFSPCGMGTARKLILNKQLIVILVGL